MHNSNITHHLLNKISEKISVNELFEEFYQQSASIIDVKIFTITKFEENSTIASRIYTNIPESYPTFGTKPVTEDHWSEQVLNNRKSFISNSIEEIADVFPDYELIETLGCGSCINVPIIINDQVLATLNCLNTKDFYQETQIEKVKSLIHGATICYLYNELNNKRGINDGR